MTNKVDRPKSRKPNANANANANAMQYLSPGQAQSPQWWCGRTSFVRTAIQAPERAPAQALPPRNPCAKSILARAKEWCCRRDLNS